VCLGKDDDNNEQSTDEVNNNKDKKYRNEITGKTKKHNKTT